MKNRLSKIFVAVIALTMLMTLLPVVPTVYADWSLPPAAVSEPDLRMGLVSDCHIRGTNNDVFTRALRPFKQMGGVEAIGIVGDLVYTASGIDTLSEREALYTNALNGWNSVFTSNAPEMVYTMGNHEFTLNSQNADESAEAKQAFKNKIGDYDSVRTINGFTFITAAPKNYLGALSSDTENYIMTNANAAIAQNPNKPVFLLIHHPPKDIFYGTMYTNVPAFYSSTFYNWLHSTPQIVFICGHSHPPIQDPKCIYQYQGGYTCLDMPMSGLTVFRYTGYEQDELWSDRVVWDFVSGTYLMEVKNNVVYIHKLDVLNNCYVGDPYVIDIPKMVAGTGGYNYTDARYNIATPPTYPENAAITLSEPETGKLKVVFANTATKTEESAPGMADNFVMGYQVKLYNASTGAVVATKKIYGDFFRTQPTTKQTSFTGLTAGTRYRVGVAPISAFDKVGNEVSKEILYGGSTITGYTFRGSSVTYDGQSHMINVTAGSDATQGVSITYTCNGSAFTGATEIGTYPVTATIKKSGYNDLILNATLRIKDPDAAERDLLADLDFSTYQPDTAIEPNDVTSSIGNITNTGILADTTRVVMSAKARYHKNELTLKDLTNTKGEKTYYFDYSNDNNQVPDKNRYRFIDEPELETQANTISVWIKYNPENNAVASRNIDILNYAIDDTNILSLRTSTSTGGDFIINDKISGANWQKNITSEAKGKWAHFVITNPTYENGQKVMKTYLNGTLLGETPVTQPAGTASSAKFAIGGTNPGNSSMVCWPMDFSFGDVKVYSGVLSDEEVVDLYNDTAYRFDEDPASVPKEITGYSFSGSTVTYDGQSHMISVEAASDATEGVNIAYTSNGAAFTGAAEVGVYPVTATITKEGYTDLVLSATLKINPATGPIEEGDLLIDLDMSTYVKDDSSTDPNSVSGSIGGIVNSGTLASSTIVKMSSQSGRWTNLDLSKETFQNAEGGTTSYIHRTINTPVCSDQNRHNIIIESALEEQANTISFWANYTPVDRDYVEYTILDYNAKYDSASEREHLFTLNQGPTSNGSLKLVGRGQSPVYGDVTDDAACKWAHYVITNPAYENGTKTMKVYVNGLYLGEKTVTQPSGTVESVMLCFGGEAAPTKAGYYWPTDISLGDIKVYAGAMSDTEVLAAYNAGKDKYTEGGVPGLENITGYTFENETVSYDGESHTIEVSAAADATEGVDIAYTCGGAAFTGASEVGTYAVTATITKAGFNNLVLNATLTIEPAQVQPIDDGEILVDLDFTNLAPSGEAGASGIVNKGTLQTAVLDFCSSDGITLSPDYLYDKDDLSIIKKVMRISHNYYDGVTAQNAKQFKISDPALENQDITLSFWTNLDPISKQTANKSFLAIAQYNAKRDDGTFKGDNSNSRATLWQYSMDTSDHYYWGSAWKYEISVNKSKEWHHVVMTIPKFEGGTKSVDIYVDGVHKLTETVSLGGHSLEESWIGLGSSEVGRYISGDISYADVKIYAGAKSADGVSALYESEKGFYDNMALNKMTVTKSGSRIDSLTNLSAGDTISVAYDENIAYGVFVFAGCYDANGKLLSANIAAADGSGDIALSIPEGFASVKIYTWDSMNLKPVQKVSTLYK